MNLFFREYGEDNRKNLIILHGLLGSSDNWHTPATRLADRFHIYCVDQRNHGRSPHLPEMNYPALAGDVLEFMEEHGSGPWFVMGHSMGGKVAMELALARPESVSRLVVVDISPFFDKPVYENVFKAILELDIGSIESRGDADDRLAGKVKDRMVRLFLLKNLKREKDGTFAWRINLEALNSNYHRIWEPVRDGRKYEGPVLFIEGGKSSAGVSEQFDEIKRLFPRAAVRRIEEAGHWVHSERPDEFETAVRDFLTD